MPASRLNTDPTDRGAPVALHDRAIDDLRYIRETMVRSAAFTAVSGMGVAAMGLVAGVAFLLARGTTAGGWVGVWFGAAAFGFLISVFGTIRKARRIGEPLMHGPGRRLILGALPALVVGGLLTLPIVADGSIEMLPSMWLMLYGTAVVGGGAFSVRPVPLMGAAFLTLGAASLLIPTGYENATMLAGFGGLHLVFGSWIARRHGG